MIQKYVHKEESSDRRRCSDLPEKDITIHKAEVNSRS